MADKNNKKQAKIPAQGIHFSPKMIGLLAEEIAKTMSTNAIENIKQYSWQGYMDKLINIYNKLLL